ncbi:MAG: pseudouridine synthase [Bacteriovoracaceae bacterium]
MILFENDYYLIVNKPSGLPVHATLDKNRDNLYDQLKKIYRKELFLIHRLDSDTSGVVLFSKTPEANKHLDEKFKNREMDKCYLAIVTGRVPQNEGLMEDFFIKKRVNGIEKMLKVERGGDKAITTFQVVERRGTYTLLKLMIKTGRMHQIRAQLSIRGMPIFGDRFYGVEFKGERLRLHAQSISFFDPFTGRDVIAIAPLPRDFFPAPKKYIKFYKPYDVLSQFTTDDGARTLAEFNLPKGVYAAGRLDKDSEGLLLLTDDGPFIEQMLNPESHQEKTYWVQVEGIPSPDALERLRKGLIIQDYKSKPAKVTVLPKDPHIPPRDPPIRVRLSIPTLWLEIKIVEGKNRQVRKMTAAIGHPTLRLVRVAIGDITLEGLSPGQSKDISHEFGK